MLMNKAIGEKLINNWYTNGLEDLFWKNFLAVLWKKNLFSANKAIGEG